jgi:hypothetical protein
MANKLKPELSAIIAAGLAWLVPGAGHAFLGRGKRGIIIFLTIAATFWAGVAMGGTMTCDSRYERWWFITQTFTGVHGLVGWQRQKSVYDRIDAELDPTGGVAPGRRPNERRMDTDGILVRDNIAVVYPVASAARAYSGVAGLLNLLCIFDAACLGLLGVSGEKKRKSQPPTESEGSS